MSAIRRGRPSALISVERQEALERLDEFSFPIELGEAKINVISKVELERHLGVTGRTVDQWLNRFQVVIFTLGDGRTVVPLDGFREAYWSNFQVQTSQKSLGQPSERTLSFRERQFNLMEDALIRDKVPSSDLLEYFKVMSDLSLQ